jgi:PAS domain S-box-containing protein
MSDMVLENGGGAGPRSSSRLAAPARVDLEDFFDNGAVALHVVAGDGTIVRANRAELEMLGYQPEEYIGQKIWDFHVDKEAIDDILRRLTGGERIERYPARLRTKSGAIRHVEITSSGRFRNGKFINTRCFTVDVTELRQAQALAAQKQRELNELLEALPTAVYTTDAQGKITYFNRAAVEFAGREPVIGKDEWCVTFRLRDSDGKPLPHEECPMAVALKKNEPVRGVEAFAERPDGSIIPFMPFPTPLRDEQGRLRGAVNMLVDMSDVKAAENEQRMLLTELNHRVKNNLQMLHSLLNSSSRKAVHPEARDALHDAAHRVAAMAAAQKLLYDARKPHSFSAADFLQAVVNAAKQTFDKQATVSIGQADAELANDAASPLALILNELLTNAVKHAKKPSVNIEIDLYEEGDLQVLVVQDDGPGFNYTKAPRGAGGLRLIDGLARQLAGTFSVEKDSGTRCVIRFKCGPKNARGNNAAS